MRTFYVVLSPVSAGYCVWDLPPTRLPVGAEQCGLSFVLTVLNHRVGGELCGHACSMCAIYVEARGYPRMPKSAIELHQDHRLVSQNFGNKLLGKSPQDCRRRGDEQILRALQILRTPARRYSNFQLRPAELRIIMTVSAPEFTIGRADGYDQLLECRDSSSPTYRARLSLSDSRARWEQIHLLD